MPNLQSDFVGRVNRLALKPSDRTALMPVMEAVSNSIHAITERFAEDAGKLGRVDVNVLRDLEKDDLPVIGFEIEDNGIGFTEENYRSFLTPDSRHKEKRGGKGVGRLAWLKVFEQVEVDSVYYDHGTLYRRHFQFRLTDKDQVEILTEGNPVQWGHYAQSHRGLCLGFDIAPSSGVTKVRYVANRISPNLKAMRKFGPAVVGHMLDLLTLKFEHWHYEEEHRLFVQLNDEDAKSGLYFFEFASNPGVKLSEIIIGAYSEISPEQIRRALGRRADDVKAHKARLAFRTFEVVAQRNQDLWRPTRKRVSLREPSFEALVEQALKAEFSKN